MDASSCCLAEQLADRRPSIRQPLVGIAASVGEEDPVASPRGLHNIEVACEVVGAVQVRGHGFFPPSKGALALSQEPVAHRPGCHQCSGSASLDSPVE